MELRQVEYFVAVARELHFGRAAEKLHVAQPSISQQIKALEAELGVRLFERTSKAVRLTGAGEELLPQAVQLLDDAAGIKRTAAVSARRVVGGVRIGFLADEYTHPASQRVLTAIRRQHPRLTLEFQQLDFAEHHRALERGEVDLAFMVGPVGEAETHVPLFDWPRLVAVSSDLAVPDGPSGDAVLAQQPIALPTPMTAQAWRISWLPWAGGRGQTFVVGEDSMEAMLALVGAGRAVCVVPTYVERFYPQPGVRFISRPEIGPCQVSLAASRAREHEPHIAAILRTASVTVARRGRGTRNAGRPKDVRRAGGGATGTGPAG